MRRDLQRLKKEKNGQNQKGRPQAFGKIQKSGFIRPVKKFDLPLFTDTLFTISAAFLLFFCIFRFYIPAFWGAAAAAFLTSAATGALCFFFLKRRREKRHLAAEDKREIQKLAFHLAMDSPENTAERIAKALAAKCGKDAKIAGGRIEADGGEYYPIFRLESATADELAPIVRRGGQTKKTALASSFTKEAEALALSFDIALMNADEVYALLKETGQLPQSYIMGAERKCSLKNGIRLRLRRASAKGYLLSGVTLLLFSTVGAFPVYYIVSGGLLLSAAVLVRIFGKT